MHVLLVDSTSALRHSLERQLSKAGDIKFHITHITLKHVEETFRESNETWDVILFGERIEHDRIGELTKILRSGGCTVPVLMLTRQSEARVPRALREAGVDDTVNTAEIPTPVFSWTFMSTLRQAEVRKKAEEFDVIRTRLEEVSHSLASIAHEINNPLSVIHLALHQLKKTDLPEVKKDLFFRLLADNVEKLDGQMKLLHNIRRQLGEDTDILTKIISAKALAESVYS